ncbi:MAG: HepT-like ribonuclease domain-containing protein [Leucobacter sp.]
MQINYFGPDALRYLRGMRNRLAHNYLGVDSAVLRATIERDLPVVLQSMRADIRQARLVLGRGRVDAGDRETWAQSHLADLTDL